MMNRTELDSANSSFSAEIQTPQTSKMDSTQNFGLESELYGHFMMCVSKGSREYMTSDLVGGRPPTRPPT